MDRVTEFIANTLAHYADADYDPKKAHEYYLRTRELKGRDPAAASPKPAPRKAATSTVPARKVPVAAGKAAGKSGRSAGKKKTGAALAAELKAAAEANKKFLEKARSEATAKRKEWSDKLSSILGDKGLAGEKRQATDQIHAEKKQKLDHVAELAKAETARIAEDATKKIESARAKAQDASDQARQKIAALPPIPAGVSKERRAELSAKRAEEIAKIRGEASDVRTAAGKEVAEVRSTASADRKKISTWLSNERDSITSDAASKQEALNKNVSNSSKAEREAVAKRKEEVGTKLKATVDKARADYEARKEQLRAKYK